MSSIFLIPELEASDNLLFRRVNLFSGYGGFYSDILTIEDAVSFVSDYYTIRYVSKNSFLHAFEVYDVLTALNNLLRECDNYEITEVFAGCFRFQKSTQGFWVLKER